MVAVHLKGDKHCFIHSSLLCRHSKRFAASLKGQFAESKNLEIHLPEECPDLFSLFVKYLYCSVMTDPTNPLSLPWWPYISLLNLAQLYVMAERFVADDFKAAITALFKIRCPRPECLRNDDICELLQLACEEIVEGPHQEEDFLRNLIFWGAATRLNGPRGTCGLRKSTKFQDLLLAHPELGKELCLRMCEGSSHVSPTPFDGSNSFPFHVQHGH